MSNKYLDIFSFNTVSKKNAVDSEESKKKAEENENFEDENKVCNIKYKICIIQPPQEINFPEKVFDKEKYIEISKPATLVTYGKDTEEVYIYESKVKSKGKMHIFFDSEVVLEDEDEDEKLCGDVTSESSSDDSSLSDLEDVENEDEYSTSIINNMEYSWGD